MRADTGAGRRRGGGHRVRRHAAAHAQLRIGRRDHSAWLGPRRHLVYSGLEHIATGHLAMGSDPHVGLGAETCQDVPGGASCL